MNIYDAIYSRTLKEQIVSFSMTRLINTNISSINISKI